MQPCPYPHIRELAPDTPENLAKMIETCLNTDPEARYQHASNLLGEMSAEMKRYADWLKKSGRVKTEAKGE